MNFASMQAWLPYKLLNQDEKLLCRWLFAGNKQFTEPFFDETILKCLSHPFNSSLFKSMSDLAFLQLSASAMDCLQPTVIIFHVSRCGSTLASQLLGLSNANIVLAEVPFLDDLLRLPSHQKQFTTADADRLFAAALSLYGQRRAGAERHLVVKTDSWHILFYQRLRRLYPNVPFVLLYRRPEEIIRSHQKKRGVHAVPGFLEKEIFGFAAEEIPYTNPDHYLAMVLEKYYAAYASIARQDKNVLLVNYEEGMLNILEKIMAKTTIRFTQKEWDAVKERAGFDAKDPERRFAEEQVQGPVPFYLQSCVDRYRQVEALRSTE